MRDTKSTVVVHAIFTGVLTPVMAAIVLTWGGVTASAQARGPVKNAAKVRASPVAKKTRTEMHPHRAVQKPLRAAVGRRAIASRSALRTHHLAEGLNSIFASHVEGISKPHPDVVKQIMEAAGAPLRGPVYVVRYGTPAAEKVTALTKENGLGMIYKGSAGNGHSMVWVGGKFTDAVPGRFSFGGGAKTRFHEFKPQSERPQLVAAFDLPKSMIGRATANAESMAHSKKQCGADCSGYVRDIMLKTSVMAKEAGSHNGIAELAGKLRTYQAPIRLRNTSLALADAVILMVSKNDWRAPENASYSIHDWNGK